MVALIDIIYSSARGRRMLSPLETVIILKINNNKLILNILRVNTHGPESKHSYSSFIHSLEIGGAPKFL